MPLSNIKTVSNFSEGLTNNYKIKPNKKKLYQRISNFKNRFPVMTKSGNYPLKYVNSSS